MGQIRSYRDLIAWRKSMRAAVRVYELTRAFPESERWGLVSQLRRAASSIPANLAEGHQRHGRREYLKHVAIARGSAAEVETHLLLAKALKMGSGAEISDILALYDDIGRLLSRLRSALSPRSPSSP